MKRLLPMINKSSSIQFSWNPQYICNYIDVDNGESSGSTIVSGPKYVYEPVIISGEAYGSVSAHVSRFDESIRCDVSAPFGGQIVCSATDSAGNNVICSVKADSPYQTLADMTLAATAISDASFVEFTWTGTTTPTSNPTCTSVTVVNGSYYFP
ncbi:MAG TPA: hypothetical protein VFW00_07445 [Rhodocyclaceae bacterium]|nr:hypothetical protein [Rhodocyclaceae bacterium]